MAILTSTSAFSAILLRRCTYFTMLTSFEFTTHTLLSSEYFADAQIDAEAFLHKMGNFGIVSS